MNLNSFLSFYNFNNPVILGLLIQFLVIFLIYLAVRSKTGFVSLFIETIYEKAYDFFEEIIGKKQNSWVKTYVILLFFTILLSNIIGLVVEIISPFFGTDEKGEFILEHYIKLPSSDINFNLSMAIISIIVILIVQFKSLGINKFFYEYFPLFGKKYISIERGNLKGYIYYPLKFIVSIFDIIISLFLSLLDIIGLFAKIISLSFRLFGNMTSGTILLAMSVVGISSMTNSILGFDFPIIVPVIIYLQELLVAAIQAFVFPLLIAIFIKVASSHEA